MGLSQFRCVVALLLVGPTVLRAQTAADWHAAAQQIVRLPPSAFPELPASVRKELERRDCRIPQLGPAFSARHSNVVSGQFARAQQHDWAVLCSRRDSSQVLVFWGGRGDAVDSWAPTADAGWLQTIGAGEIQYSQYVTIADSASIATNARAFGSPQPPGPITHDGLEQGFAEKTSTIKYWFNGRWYAVQGAD